MTTRQLTLLVYGLIALILVTVGLVGLFLWASYTPVDTQSFCPLDGKITGHTMVLVDQTDSLTIPQVRELKIEMQNLKASLPIYARLSIITIGKVVEIPPPYVFSLCNPGRSDQVNPFDQTASFVQANYEAQFSKPLDEVLDRFILPSTEIQSPIMETIAEVTKMTSFNGQIPNRHLVIFSDLLQNTGQLSQYSWVPETFAQFLQNAGYSNLPDLNNTDVDIFYLPRPPVEYMQGVAHRQFWIEFFKASGASSINWCGLGSATLEKKVIECVPASNS